MCREIPIVEMELAFRASHFCYCGPISQGGVNVIGFVYSMCLQCNVEGLDNCSPPVLIM